MSAKNVTDNTTSFNELYELVDAQGQRIGNQAPVSWLSSDNTVATVTPSPDALHSRAVVNPSGKLGPFTITGDNGTFQTHNDYVVIPGPAVGAVMTDDLP